MMEEQEKMMNLRARRKRSSVGIVSCFTGHQRRASLDASSNVVRSPSSWFKSCRSNDSPGKCRNFISRMAHHRRHSSADFSYDPLSYALNFEDDQFRALSFNARLRKTAYSNHDHNLPRSPMNRGGGSDDLRRGFEALSASLMKPTRRSNNTDQEVTSISSNPEILAQLC